MKATSGAATSGRARAGGAGPSAPIRRLLMALALAGALGLLLALFWQRPAPAAGPAAPTRYLEDRAGLLSAPFIAAKNQYLEYLSRTARIAQVNVVILPRESVPDVEAFSIEAATAWKIGAGGADNGLALLVFPGNRQMRLEVGYGLEYVLTDAQASGLLNDVVAPAFARGQYETGIEDFLSALDKMLTSSEAAQHRAAQDIELIPFVKKVLRTAPGAAGGAWRQFVAADTATRLVMALLGAVALGLALYALTGIALALPALVLLPLRIRASPTLRAGWVAARDQFALRNFLARPPPALAALFDELQLAPVVNAAYLLAALVVGTALVFATAGWFVEGLGRFGGAGATIAWPAPG